VSEAAATRARRCGACSLCCTVLRVDEIAKLGGTVCQHVRDGGGCAIHASRPQICRAYHCLWLRGDPQPGTGRGGQLGDDDRPDRLGAVLDVVQTGASVRLSIRQATPHSYDRSPRLQQIAAEFRESMPVRISDVSNVADPDQPFRVLLADGEEQIVAGDRVTFVRDGTVLRTTKLPWPERFARRAALRWRALRLRWIGSR